VFDLIANVRKKASGEYVYSIQLNENKKIKASPLIEVENSPRQSSESAFGKSVPHSPSESQDLSFQDRDPNSLDNRTLLSKAMESAARNDIEKKYIKDYQAKIDKINKEEQHLTELRAEIKELSFAKGRRDADRIRSLQDEATKTANRINTYDKMLLRLEASKPLKEVLSRERMNARRAAEKKVKAAHTHEITS